MNLLMLVIAILPSAETVITGDDFKTKIMETRADILQAKDVKLMSGDRLVIHLPASSGTGYAWQLMGQDFEPLLLKQSGILPRTRPLPGGKEIHEFVFTANQMGKGMTRQIVLVFNLRRSFEGVGEKFLQVRVVVGEQ